MVVVDLVDDSAEDSSTQAQVAREDIPRLHWVELYSHMLILGHYGLAVVWLMNMQTAAFPAASSSLLNRKQFSLRRLGWPRLLSLGLEYRQEKPNDRIHSSDKRWTHKGCYIFWISATNVENLKQAYLDVAQQFDIPGWAEEKVSVKKLVQDQLSK